MHKESSTFTAMHDVFTLECQSSFISLALQNHGKIRALVKLGFKVLPCNYHRMNCFGVPCLQMKALNNPIGGENGNIEQ